MSQPPEEHEVEHRPAVRAAVELVAAGVVLPAPLATAAMEELMDGVAPPTQVAALLGMLHVRGETPEELAAFARVMRDRAVRVEAPDEAVDLCGTGADGAGTFNISTLAAFVVAGAGAPVLARTFIGLDTIDEGPVEQLLDGDPDVVGSVDARSTATERCRAHRLGRRRAAGRAEQVIRDRVVGPWIDRARDHRRQDSSQPARGWASSGAASPARARLPWDRPAPESRSA